MKVLKIEENTLKEEISLNIERKDNILKIDVLPNEEDSYKNLDSPFYNLEFDLENFELRNYKEIIAKWDMKYKENLLYGQMDEVELTVSLDQYFRDKDSLGFILKNYLYIPFILILFKKENLKNYTFYDILNVKELEFDIEKKIEEDRENKKVEIKGKISSNFDFVGLKSKLREELDIKPSEIFNLETEFKGEAIYLNEELKAFSYRVELKDKNEKVNRYLTLNWE